MRALLNSSAKTTLERACIVDLLTEYLYSRISRIFTAGRRILTETKGGRGV